MIYVSDFFAKVHPKPELTSASIIPNTTEIKYLKRLTTIDPLKMEMLKTKVTKNWTSIIYTPQGSQNIEEK